MDGNRAKALREIIQRAILRETAAYNHCRKARVRSEDPQLAAVFVQLAEEERKHHALLLEELRRIERYVISPLGVKSSAREMRLEPASSPVPEPPATQVDHVGADYVRFSVPADLPFRHLPTIPEIDLAAVSMPLQMVGGDHVDTLVLERPGGGALAFLLFDVVGHGLAATRLKASAIQHFGDLRQDWMSHRGPQDLTRPSHVMRDLNKRLHPVCASQDRFLTALYCVLDPSGQALRYASAGHEPPILIRANGEYVGLTETDVMLGVFEDSEFREWSARLLPGDLTVFFSDGIPEAIGPAGTMFEREHIRAAAQRESGRSAAKILRGIVNDLRTFLGSEKLADEASLAVLKVAGAKPPAR